MFQLLPESDFDFLSREKGLLVHIVNECCEESLKGKWLVIEETVASILIEVRYLEKLERADLCNRVFSYVDNTPGVAQKVRRVGEKNQIVRVEVKWPLSDSVHPGAEDQASRQDRKENTEPVHHLECTCTKCGAGW